MKQRHLLFPTLMIALSGIVIYLTSSFPVARFQQDASVDAAFFPIIIAAIQIILCVLLIAQKQIPTQAHKTNQRISTFAAVL